jgi:competence protein ComEC
MEVGGHVVLHVAGRRALAGLDGCGGADILVSSVEVERALPCLVFDPVRLRRTGAVALTSGPEGLRLVTAGEAAGLRPWTRPAADRAAADRPAAPPIPANLLLAAVDQ